MPSSTPLKGERVAFGRRIRKARTAKGYSKAEAARMMGVKVQSWQQWERGLTSPRPEKIAKLASVLGVSANELLGIGFETTFAGSPDEAARVLEGNYQRAKDFVALHGEKRIDPVRMVRDSDQKAVMEAYGRLDPELRHWLRGLIHTLDQAQNPQYSDYAPQHEGRARKKAKAG